MDGQFYKQASKRILQLEGLRFIMCCIIILSHLEFLGGSGIFGDFYTTYLHNATLAVDYFFMLSGFGIYLSSKRPECTLKNAYKFAVDKVKKIYPAYLFSLLISLPITVYTLLKFSGIGKAILKLFVFLGADVTLYQSIAGTTMFSHSINGVCWFLSTLFICYIACPWLLRVVDKIRNKSQALIMICGLVVITLALSSGALLIQNNLSVLNDLWYGHPFIRCWYLAIGMCIGYLYKESKTQMGSGQELLIGAIAIAYFFGRNSIPLGKGLLRFLDIVLCIIFLYVFACGRGKLSDGLSTKLMVNLGKISMYLFLFHYPVRMLIGTVFDNNGWNSEWLLLIQVALIIIITCLITYLYRFVEDRLEARQNRLKTTLL